MASLTPESYSGGPTGRSTYSDWRLLGRRAVFAADAFREIGIAVSAAFRTAVNVQVATNGQEQGGEPKPHPIMAENKRTIILPED